MIWDDLVSSKPKKQKKAKPDINSDELLFKIRYSYGYEAYMYIKPIIDKMLGKKDEAENED